MTRTALLKAVLLLCGTLTVMASAVLAPVLPSVEAAFAGTEHAALMTRMVLSLPALFIVLGAPLAGRLTDSWGRRPVLLWGLALYGLGGASGAVLDSLPQILVGRAVLGLGVAGIMTASVALVADHFQGQERARLLGLQQAFSHGGVIFVQAASGAVALLSWRLPFYAYLAAFALLALAFFVAAEPRAQRRAQAMQPVLPAVSGARGLNLAILACGMFVMGCFYITPVQLSFYLQELAGTGPLLSGLAFAWMSVCATGGALAYARIVPHLDHARCVALTCALMCAGYVWVGAASGGYVSAMAGISVMGFGFGLLLPNLAAWLTDIAPAARRGRAAGGLTLAVFLGQFVSPLVTQPFIERASYGAVFAGAGVSLFVLGAVFLLARPVLLRETERQRQPAPAPAPEGARGGASEG